MKKTILYLLCVVVTIKGICQDGSPGNPFTLIGQAQSVSTSGIYSFIINGTPFTTYVQAPGGWVLMASGTGTGVSPMTRTATLTLQSDAVLPLAAYNNMVIDITEVRFNSDISTAGPPPADHTPFDVKSSDARLIANLRIDQTLSAGMPFNDFSMWTSIGSNPTDNSFMEIQGFGSVRTLARTPYDAENFVNGFTWSVPNDENVFYSDPGRNAINMWIRGTSGTLPVELVKFNVTSESNQIKLDWATITEINNEYFVVEKSLDGFNWEVLGRVNGAGNSNSRKEYVFYDRNPVNAKQFYRIKQIDLDGKSKYSVIRIISYKSASLNKILIYPNPVIDNLNLSIEANSFSNSSITLFDMFGKVQFTAILISNTLSIDSRRLSKGFYVLEVNLNGSIQRVKVVKE